MKFKRIKEEINDLQILNNENNLNASGKHLLNELEIALRICRVGVSLPEEKELVSEMDKNWKRISNDIPNLNKVTFYISFRTCYRWLKNELK